MAVTTLAEAKTHLNITATTNDTELAGFIDRAEAAIARRTGPLVDTSVTQRVDGGSVLVLRYSRVLSLTSITPVGGAALALTGLYVEHGVVQQDGGGGFPASRYDVVYRVGFGALAADVPADLRLAVLELIRHLWATQRGGVSRPSAPMSQETSNTIPGAAYLFPFRVEQLLAPYMPIPGA